MPSASSQLLSHATLVAAAVAYLVSVAAMVTFVGVRRIVRERYFVRRDRRACELRQLWPRILAGAVDRKSVV